MKAITRCGLYATFRRSDLVNHHPRGKTFICDDARLLEAAEKEGFDIVRM
jgi:hypothetical protein